MALVILTRYLSDFYTAKIRQTIGPTIPSYEYVALLAQQYAHLLPLNKC